MMTPDRTTELVILEFGMYGVGSTRSSNWCLSTIRISFVWNNRVIVCGVATLKV